MTSAASLSFSPASFLLNGDPDCALMLRAGEGCDSSFSTLVIRHRNALLNFFARLGACSESEDLTQDTLVRVFRYRGRYQPTAKFATFLFTVARHVWMDRGRRVMRRERATSQFERECTVQTTAEASDRGIDVESALERLSPKLREVVHLHFYQGLRYQDIALRLGVPLGTVKSRVSLAMTAMREMVEFSR